MRKAFALGLTACLIFAFCRKAEKPLYTIGYLELLESPTTSEIRQGFFKALEEHGLKDGVNIRLKIRNALNDISRAQQITQDFVSEDVDLIVAVSTAGLQAVLMATQKIPVVFSSVGSPYLTKAGVSPTEHLSNVTGVASTGPIRQALAFIKETRPDIKRVGTLWTPSELNSEYYLELARGAAVELGIEIVAVPVANSSEVLLAAQVLVNKKIDVIYQISDNTINASFEAIGRIAEENRIPLFGGFLLATHAGACAAMGWDLIDMGTKTGRLVWRIKNGESPAAIPIQSMTDVKLNINLKAAEKQGMKFSPDVLKRASEILASEDKSMGTNLYHIP